MSDEQNKPPSVPAKDIAGFVLGIILFGVFMGLRTESQSVWVRMLLAGCAGTALGSFVLPLRNYRR